MNPGKRDKPIELQRDQSDDSDFAIEPENWKTYHEAWASINPSSGNETEFAEGIEAKVSHVIDIDYPFADVVPSDRIAYGGRIFEIVAVINPKESDETLRLFASEVIG